MIVEDVMTKEVVTVGPETSLKDVARTLTEHRISGVPVVDEGCVLGVVSETDLISDKDITETSGRSWHVFAHEQTNGSEPRGLARTAADAMTTPAITIAGREPLEAAAALMGARDINRLPVVDGRGLAGIVTRADVVSAFARSDEEIRVDVVRAVRSQWVDPDTLTIEVADGVVTLAGEVTMPKGVKAIVADVEAIPGVVGVRSELVQGEYKVRRRSFARRAARRFDGDATPVS